MADRLLKRADDKAAAFEGRDPATVDALVALAREIRLAHGPWGHRRAGTDGGTTRSGGKRKNPTEEPPIVVVDG